MLQAIIIGNVGADAQLQSKDGRDFTTFRVAHNDSWTDQAGQQHTSSIWVDCIMSGHAKVAEYIRQGTTVCVMGTVSLRVYSSEKDRCMKCGMTINVRSVELIGSRPDAVPSRLYDAQGAQHNVQKYYLTDVKSCKLRNMRSDIFDVDASGWVTPCVSPNPTPMPTPAPQDTNSEQSQDEPF